MNPYYAIIGVIFNYYKCKIHTYIDAYYTLLVSQISLERRNAEMALNIATKAVLVRTTHSRASLLLSAMEKISENATGHTGTDGAACIPAFLQIRPGKADSCNLFSSPTAGWVEGKSRYF